MKKLMIAAAAIALACGVNAAQVAWTAAAISASPDGGVVAGTTKYSSYLFLTASDYEPTKVVASLSTVTDALSQGNLDILKSANASGQATANASGKFSFTSNTKYGSYDKDMSATGFMVIIDADQNYFLVAEKSGEALLSGTSNGTSNISLGWGSQSGNTAWTAVAPEPTSGLLLLLGVAGLALRRRRA